MRIHHLNLAGMREIDSLDGRPSKRAVCHALLVETPGSGLVLVEAGLGLDDVTEPGEHLDREWTEFVEPVLSPPRRPCGRWRRSGTTPPTYAMSCSPTSTSTTAAACPTSRRPGCT
ncbi:hypothetical protein ACFQYP_59270 [Nonomuraea antimicrobica]